jgi:transposase InsO family protein
MPWQECTVMESRREFVTLATREGANVRALCRRFGISPKTGYKWLARYAAAGVAGLADRSRRPHTSPRQTPAAIVARVCAMRRATATRTWGGRKIHHALLRAEVADVPAPSTITRILGDADLLRAEPDRPATGRFARATPNELWQLDFMGHRPLQQGRVHPLTLVDDHSRYLLTLMATDREDFATVQAILTACFRRWGLPWTILTDNGSPWGHEQTRQDRRIHARAWTRFEVWLLRLGITVTHGRPAHPQTQGKVERVHGTIATDVFGTRVFADLAAAQAAFDSFRTTYNHDRPHEALSWAVPAERYAVSPRSYPEMLPELAYADDAQVRVVAHNGAISFRGHRIQIGKAFGQQRVGIIPTAIDGQFRVLFAHQPIATFDLRSLDRTAPRCYPCP